MRKYQNAEQELNKLFKNEVQESLPDKILESEETSDDLLETAINATVPPKYQQRASLIIKHARNIPHITVKKICLLTQKNWAT